MQGTPLCNAAPLGSYVAALRAIGADVDSGLHRAKLPVHFEEQLDGWLPNLGVRQFLGDMAHRKGLADLGWRAARVGNVNDVMDTGIASLVLAAPTAFKAVVTLTRTIQLQSTQLKIWLVRTGASLWLCHAHAVGASYPGYAIVEA